MKPEFLEELTQVLGTEVEDYLACLEQTALKAIRINTLKRDTLPACFCDAKPHPFAGNGYIIPSDVLVGWLPEYLCGHVYSQEPSASFPVTAMDIQPGMKVLDLCAAPGSKSTQIAECLNHEGVLVANEIVERRAAILKENLERHGVANAIILNNRPDQIADVFEDYFDAVLCDAPCSGEGMFRKDAQAVEDWSPEAVEACAVRQRKILESAIRCVKPGGILLYSTCTFSLAENEETVAYILKAHPELHLVSIEAAGGRPGVELEGHTSFTRRIYPMDGGEGQFAAKFRKEESDREGSKPALLNSAKLPSDVLSFLNEHCTKNFPYLYVQGERVYGGTSPFIECRGLHLIRHQAFLGTYRNHRFEPSHALALSAYAGFIPTVELTEEEFLHYRKGETLRKESTKGWNAVTVQGMRAGLVKSDGTILKNHYPKAFRIR